MSTAPSSAARLLGVDWGSTHRRAYWVDGAGTVIEQRRDSQGLLSVGGRFEQSLAELVASGPALAADAPIVLSGAVGGASGWHEVPYIDAPCPLSRWVQGTVDVPASLAWRVRIVPGCRWRDPRGTPDVMRGEETQLVGATQLDPAGSAERWYCLPGTHGKWVRVAQGEIRTLHSYLTGELFALLTRHGMLAPLTAEGSDDDASFLRGVDAAGGAALSHVLFSCRARVVSGDMPQRLARSFLSGALIGAEWHDMHARHGAPAQVSIVGSPELARLHALAASRFGSRVVTIDPDQAYVAALRLMQRTLS